ncbi:cation diffusion facilitator family transporter [Veillonella agrestimuris]|uniref:cation diffusion facilitator family transporter n=1 Tax=Veillonella agrestimuris TaxID=2941340 RepID=UPI00203E1999|nr:cation diffusion facilitator family transporter [Veillonella agrestimuris]
MDILGARRSIEQKLLMQSVALMSLVAISGTIMGVVTGSSAVLLDGVFSFVDVIIKIMMLMTAKLVARETSKRFQFGYWQFEPLVLAVEGFFILLIVIYALFSGITDLLGGGRHVDFGPAIYYAIFFTIADTAYYFYVKRINKSLQSNLVKFDNVSWYVDALLEAAILISFVVAILLEGTEYEEFAVYIDPIVLIVLALQMVPSVIHILVPATKQILGWAPTSLHNEVQEIMDRFMEKYNFKDYVTSVQAYGNTRIIEIDILVRKNFPYQTIAELDGIRNEIDEEIGGNPTEKWVTISFTSTRKWMAKDYLLDEEDDD